MYSKYNFVCIQKIKLKRNSKESDLLFRGVNKSWNYKKILSKKIFNDIWNTLKGSMNCVQYEL